MLKPALLLLLALGPSSLPAVTVEVVRLYQPLSLHGTDGVGDDLDGEDPVQAGVFSCPMAISGAMPEDLVKAIARPHQIGTNSPVYAEKDANLLNLCKVKLTSEMKGDQLLLVRIDVTDLRVPEELDLTGRHVVRLTVSAIRRTLKDYFKHGEETLQVSIGVIGTNESNASLKDLSVRFKVGK